MSTNEEKQRRLRAALTVIRDQPSSPAAVRDLIVASWLSLIQGSGLGWSQVDAIIAEVYGSPPDPPTLGPRSD